MTGKCKHNTIDIQLNIPLLLTNCYRILRPFIDTLHNILMLILVDNIAFQYTFIRIQY